jgi:cyclophilin family peptidyl-prolyl cis-trans isomerase
VTALRVPCIRLLDGGKSRFFEDEIRPDLRHRTRGVVAMASTASNLNASQVRV